MYSGMGTRALPRAGFPIRISRDQRLVSTYSGLFAAAHVLLRLLAPRHPPCALSLLIVKNTLYAAMEFSRCAPAPKCPAKREKAARRQVSQNSAVPIRRPHEQSSRGLRLDIASDVEARRGRRNSRRARTGRIHHGRAAPGVKALRIP